MPPPSPLAKLRLERLEAREVPALYTVGMMGPGTGMSGDTAATVSGALALDSALPTDSSGRALIEATSAQDAVSRAFVGTITVQFGGETLTYTFGPASVGFSPMEHKPFLFTGGSLALEDMAGSANGSDWDYNDHFWMVGASEQSGGGGSPPMPPPGGGGGSPSGSGQLNWLGADAANVMSAANWEERFNPSAHRAPTATDDLYFVGGSSGRNADCVLPSQLLSVRGLHLIEAYSGRVVTRDNEIVGNLELASGSIAQGYASDGMNDLRVTTYFDVRGGTLNSTGALGTVHLTGFNGRGTQANLSSETGATTIGSTLSLEGLGTEWGGAQMGIFVGDYAIKNGADFNTGQYCSTEISRPLPLGVRPAFPVVYSPTRVKFETIGDGAKEYTRIITKDGGFSNFIGNFDGAVKLVIGGSVRIDAGVIVTLTDPADGAQKSVMVLADGVLSIVNSAQLIAPHEVQVAGRLNTIYKVGLTVPQTAFIDSELTIFDTGILSITDNALADQFGTLAVSEDITIDGSLIVQVDGGGSGQNESINRDHVDSAENLKLTADAKLNVTSSNATGPMRVGRIWDIAKVTKVIIGAAPAPIDPRFSAAKLGVNTTLQIQYLGG